MTEELDSGPYLAKFFFNLSEETYIGEIYSWLEKIIPTAFIKGIENIFINGYIPQESTIRTLRTFPRKPEDSRINWEKNTKNILALIRASSYPFNGAFCFLNNEIENKVFIFKAKEFVPNFDFCAISGQVCFINHGNMVIATNDGMIEIEECYLQNHSHNESVKLISKSLRNRLT
jgi:methionyl-tRNA formyltransferase